MSFDYHQYTVSAMQDGERVLIPVARASRDQIMEAYCSLVDVLEGIDQKINADNSLINQIQRTIDAWRAG